MHELETFMHTFVSRCDDFALQRTDGGYMRVGRPLTTHELHAHLTGKQTIGSYVIDEQGQCSYAVFDADSNKGLHILRGVQCRFALEGMTSYLEQSRRGGHLWVFLAQPVKASHLRKWLLPYCPSEVEFYPKQDESKGYGSLIRLPLGVHLRSGKRYPFVEWTPTGFRPLARTVPASVAWLTTVQRLSAGPEVSNAALTDRIPTSQEKSFSKTLPPVTQQSPPTIRAWCAQQDPYSVIGRYVTLNAFGVGCCPFGWHHANGRDTHASFKVYPPGVPGGYCWYCHVWQQGGSVFDFLRYYYQLDAHTLWQRIRAG